jgi:hypothetical protein
LLLGQSDKLYCFQGQREMQHMDATTKKICQVHVINKLLKTKHEIPKLTSKYYLFSFNSFFIFLSIFSSIYIRNQLKQQTQKAKLHFYFSFAFSGKSSSSSFFHFHCRFYCLVFMERVVGGKYRIGRKIGSGSFGEIYIGNINKLFHFFLL